MKAITSVSIDPDLLKKAQKSFINISGIFEDAIRAKLNFMEIELQKPSKCDFCGKIDEKATVQNPDKLTWLWPDNKWICDDCFHRDKPVSAKGEIYELAKQFAESIRKELAEAVKAGLTGNEMWAGEVVKKPVKVHS